MMALDYKMKYLEDLKAKTQKKWDALNEKIFANPLGEIIELHKKAIEIINRDRKDYAQMAAEKFNESNRRTSRTRNRYCRYKP